MSGELHLRKIPFPLLLLVALFGLGGILLTLGGLLTIFKNTLVGLYLIVSGLIALYVSYGLYNNNKIAWIIAVVLESVNIVADIVRLALHNIPVTLAVFGIIINGLILAILFYYASHYNISFRKSASVPASPAPAAASIVDVNTMRYFKRLK